ncbi:peptidylprolyl isomerase [Ruminococcus sp. Marseille-P6503]|uniref:peptidylprolyl isomerase n=1 Tax=Ruminococcus sp. Marseille-P6503 TaxID=2364796 RepID=UPI000F523382|nr:peptidylprolyl isomerase [Ruminococcus sp. Marseille-P6503]
MKRIMKKIALTLCAALTLGLLSSCGDTSESSDNGAQLSGNEKSFVITLYSQYAPITCENFEELVKDGFYNGLTFHRVVEDFMAQGGDPNGDGTGGSEKTIKGEFSANGVDNKLSHTRGIVSMARSQAFDSASSQFFICYTDECTFLDGQYAAFGEVTEGMETVDSFLEIERTLGSDGAMSSPSEPITIVKAEMISDDADGNHRAEFFVTVGE